MVTMSTKNFLKPWWLHLYSFPLIFNVLKLTTMLTLYCIIIDLISAKFTLFHHIVLTNKKRRLALKSPNYTYRSTNNVKERLSTNRLLLLFMENNHRLWSSIVWLGHYKNIPIVCNKIFFWLAVSCLYLVLFYTLYFYCISTACSPNTVQKQSIWCAVFVPYLCLNVSK